MKINKMILPGCMFSCMIFSSVLQADTGLSDVENGNSYREQGDNYKAMYYYQLALSKEKDNTDALYQLSLIDYEKGQYSSALRNMNRFIAIKQDEISALILRGKIYSKQHRWREALNDLEVAEKQDTDNPEIQILLDNVNTAMGNAVTAKKHIKNFQHIRKQQIKNSKRRTGQDE